MELTMFERMLQLPLLQGLTAQEMSEVMSHVRLDFVNYQSGDEIVMQDAPCRNLIYIISGELMAEYRDPQYRFTLTEYLPQVKVLEPYNMFGMYQKYSRTYQFKDDGITLNIDKQVVLKRLMANTIVKINLMNITCNRYQQTLRILCDTPENTVKDKIVKFLLSYSSVPKGAKELKIKMVNLADILHETRLKVSQTLNDMEREGMLTLQRGYIAIPEIQDLYK